MSRYEMFRTDANEPESVIQYATGPRYLAGGGDPRRVTEVLRAGGWTNHSDPCYPHVLLASPDTAVRMSLEPAPDSWTQWWRFHAASDTQRWYAAFGGHTPVEILAGFTDALIQPTPEQQPSLAGIRDVLASTGWSREYDRRGIESARSPDKYVRIGPYPGLDGDVDWPTWHAEASHSNGMGGYERIWQAWFSHDTPAHLVAGFAGALVSTEPVYRGSYGLPNSWLLTQERTGVQGEHLAESHRQRLDATRAAARKLRKAALATTPGPAPPTPTTAQTRRR